MKRSEINTIIAEAKDFISRQGFQLPPWAFWGPEDWKGKADMAAEIAANMLGWDITDFAKGDFNRFGLVLFTLRNGNLATGDRKTYAEKIMVVREGQATPMHFHWHKMEDIINRGGGNLVLKLYNSTADEKLDDTPVAVKVDSITRHLEPGEPLILTPGESVCLVQGLYHTFYAEPGHGTALIGEVSQVNDDNTDNRFNEPLARFSEIEEDEAPLHVLGNEYERFF